MRDKNSNGVTNARDEFRQYNEQGRVVTSRAQRESMAVIYQRHSERWPSYRAFRKAVQAGRDCLMVAVGSMWIGIEADGYRHT